MSRTATSSKVIYPSLFCSGSETGTVFWRDLMRVCQVEGCGKKHKGYGYCQTHLRHLKEKGLFGGSKKCSIGTCDKFVRARGYCDKHYIRYRLGKNPEEPSSLDKRPPIFKEGFALLALGPNAKDGYATIDIEDAERLSKYNWFLAHDYPSRSMTLNKLNKSGRKISYQQRLHREVMNLDPYDERDIDHEDTNKLNNRKYNLRFCTQLQNNRNKPKTQSNRSGYKGVSWKKKNRKWCVQIQTGFNVQHVGLFTDKHDAANVYNQFAEQIFGEFAYLNEILPQGEEERERK